MIGLVDYGMGNLRSVEKALQYVGGQVRRVTNQSEMDQLQALVVPGQGAFRDCIAHLHQHGLWEGISNWLKANKPFLGLCLGQHVLFETSFENGVYQGLGFLKGTVNRFSTHELKIPQIGWNQVEITLEDCPIFRDLPDKSWFYFDHSYIVHPADPKVKAGLTTYGETFSSVVWQGNCFAVQFHPEKSQRSGLRLLKNFVCLSQTLR